MKNVSVVRPTFVDEIMVVEGIQKIEQQRRTFKKEAFERIRKAGYKIYITKEYY